MSNSICQINMLHFYELISIIFVITLPVGIDIPVVFLAIWADTVGLKEVISLDVEWSINTHCDLLSSTTAIHNIQK